MILILPKNRRSQESHRLLKTQRQGLLRYVGIMANSSVDRRYMVGLAGLEPATFRPPDGRATRLRYSPTNAEVVLFLPQVASAKSKNGGVRELFFPVKNLTEHIAQFWQLFLL